MNSLARIPASLICLAMLLGCDTDSDRSIAGTPSASLTTSFSAWSQPVSLGPVINAPGFNDQQAALSKDELSLYFASSRPEDASDVTVELNIWVSQRACADDSCPWGAPLSLGPTVNSAVNDIAPALSRDGHWLFFASNRATGLPGASDIWVSWRENVHDDFGWQAPELLGPGVNTGGFEGGPAYFENAELGVAQLFFNRNPVPVNTGGDIYMSEQAADGSWNAAVSVSELNSAAGDQRPSVAPSGLDIYFYSNRPGSNANSNDIWVATRESGLDPWSAPTNLGPPINTAASDVFPYIVFHGGTERLYFTRNVAAPPAADNDLFVTTRTQRGGQE